MSSTFSSKTAQELAQQLANFTITSLETDNVIALPHGNENRPRIASKNLIEFPNEVLVKIFGLVGSSSFNSNSPPFFDYLAARCEADYATKKSNREKMLNNPNGQTKDEWRSMIEYPIKNLICLRRVCKRFDDIITNTMVPGIDYAPLMVDIKIKGFNDTRAVTMYKYGGTGSQYPSTRLNRIRRFNEMEYDHIQKFEKIRKLYLVDMVLNEELFETVLNLDLTMAKKITFERIKDINFKKEDIVIPNYIQEFLTTINSPANVFFNSNSFNPNFVLFNDEMDEMEEMEEEQMHNDFDGFLLMDDDELPEHVRDDPRRVLRLEIAEIEKLNHRHRKIRHQRPKLNVHFKEFRGYRTINIVNNMIFSKQHNAVEDFPYDSEKGQEKYMKDMFKKLRDCTTKKEFALAKTAKWHMGRVFRLLNGQPIKPKKALMYHLKMLKKICGEDLEHHDEKISLVNQSDDIKKSEQFLQQFPFLERSHLSARLYTS